jgi:hypothetical protein
MNINELATKSMGTKKNTKMAFDTILKIIKQSESLNDIAINEYKNLYAFFSPPTKAKKDKWAWMYTFCSKHDDKPFLKYVWANEKYIYATDGFIMARSVNDLNLQNGVYDKNKTKLNKDIRTPDANIIFERFDFSDAQLFTDELKEVCKFDFPDAQLLTKKSDNKAKIAVHECYYFDSIKGYIFDKKLYDKATAYTGLAPLNYALQLCLKQTLIQNKQTGGGVNNKELKNDNKNQKWWN